MATYRGVAFLVRGALLIGALVFLTSCQIAAGSASSASSTVTVTDQDDGGQVALKVGQVLIVSLQANPTTGYSWEVTQGAEALRQIGETEFSTPTDRVGAGGIQTIRFEAVKASDVAFQMVYRRPWGKGVEPIQTFAVELTIQ